MRGALVSASVAIALVASFADTARAQSEPGAAQDAGVGEALDSSIREPDGETIAIDGGTTESTAPDAAGDPDAAVLAAATPPAVPPSDILRQPPARRPTDSIGSRARHHAQARDDERARGERDRNAHTSWLERLHFEGFVDTYVMLHLQEPDGDRALPGSGVPRRQSVALRAFDSRASELALSYTELAVWLPPEPVGFRLDLGFGPTASTVHSRETAERDDIAALLLQTVQQAFGTARFPVGTGLTLDAGKLASPIGLERIEARDDWAYSRSHVFSFGLPFYVFGLRLGYTASPAFGADLYLVNGWNAVFESNAGKTFGVRLRGRVGALGGWTIAYLGGPEDPEDEHFRHCGSLTLTASPIRALSLALDAVAGTDTFTVFDPVTGEPVGRAGSWAGAAIAMRFAPVELFAAAIRAGLFLDDSGELTGLEQTLHEVTLTLELRYARNMIVRLEWRHDGSSEDVFYEPPSAVRLDDTGRRSQDTFALAAILGF